MRAWVLTLLLVTAGLAGCLEQPSPEPTAEPEDPTAGDPTDDAADDGHEEPSGDAEHGDGMRPEATFMDIDVDVRPYGDNAYPGTPVFEALYPEIVAVLEGIKEGSRSNLSTEDLGDPNLPGFDRVMVRFNATEAAKLDGPAGQGEEGVLALVVLDHPNTTLAGKVLLCSGEETCTAYETEAELATLTHRAHLFGPEILRYWVNGTAKRDAFREQGWVHLKVPIAGTINITGEEDSPYADDACVGHRTGNNTTVEVCGEELHNRSAFVEGHVVGFPQGPDNRADIALYQEGISGTAQTPIQNYRFDRLVHANETWEQLAIADPGWPSVQLLISVAEDVSPAEVAIQANGTTLFEGTVTASKDGAAARTSFQQVQTLAPELTVTRDGQRLEGVGNLTLPGLAYVHVTVHEERYTVDVSTSPPAVG